MGTRELRSPEEDVLALLSAHREALAVRGRGWLAGSSVSVRVPCCSEHEKRAGLIGGMEIRTLHPL